MIIRLSYGGKRRLAKGPLNDVIEVVRPGRKESGRRGQKSGFSRLNKEGEVT